jgi:DNA-binding response OmpR family regulator
MSSSLRLLYVEDDAALGLILSEQLSDVPGWGVDWISNGMDAAEAAKKNTYDVAILDVMLPGMDGFSLAKVLREKAPKMPILFLTARDAQQDVLQGLSQGDDYMSKPFSTEELLLRIRNLAKRSMSGLESKEPARYELGQYSFDYHNFLLVHAQGEERRLTEREGKLLHYLCQQSKAVIRREDLLQAVWGKTDYFTGRSMDVFISKLRKYVSADPRIKIQVVHGIGFEFIRP